MCYDNCKNKHENIISLNEFESTRYINEDKIICAICNTNNKGSTSDNKFYICGTYNNNISLLCKDNYNNDHIFLDNKDYFLVINIMKMMICLL